MIRNILRIVVFTVRFRTYAGDVIQQKYSRRSEDPKLIIRVINYFELDQRICSRYINVTDGQTDGRTTCDSNTALAHVHRAVKTAQAESSLERYSRSFNATVTVVCMCR